MSKGNQEKKKAKPTSKASPAKPANRGKIEEIKLSRPIVFNGNEVKKAKIEIDHINFGLDLKTGKLNEKRRLNFTVKDVEKFILMLDDEDIAAKSYSKSVSRFVVEIDCPVKRHHYGKVFVMIFEHDYHKEEEIYTVTLIPGWEK